MLANTQDPGGANLPLNPTNIHTHGLVVQARAPTLSDPTFGDYIFVDIYNPANGIPVPQGTHQHGSVVMGFADYRIDIPANHPSGAYWFHPHVHGLAVNQVSSGMAGIISVGKVGDYAFGDLHKAPFPEANVRHLVLKDMQVLAAGTYVLGSGSASVADGTVLNQEDPTFCTQFPASPAEIRQGSCPGADNTANMGNNYTGGTWFLTVSGQQFPTIPMTEPDGEIWRLTNASANVTYDLQLDNDATQAPMIMQLISVDGVSINVPPPTSLETEVQLGGVRFKVVACPPAPTSGLTSVPVCVSQFVMMPSSRAELWVTYRDANGNVATPPAGATGTFRTIGITTGPAGDAWPGVDLAKVAFEQTGPRRLAAFVLDVYGDALRANLPTGIFTSRVPYAKAAPLPPNCTALAAGHHRRIFYGLVDPTNPASQFGLGYEEVDRNGVVVPGTQLPVTAFDPSQNTVCLPLGPGQTPVHETWELVNLATENHNFHIHQTKFRFVQAGVPARLTVCEPDQSKSRRRHHGRQRAAPDRHARRSHLHRQRPAGLLHHRSVAHRGVPIDAASGGYSVLPARPIRLPLPHPRSRGRRHDGEDPGRARGAVTGRAVIAHVGDTAWKEERSGHDHEESQTLRRKSKIRALCDERQTTARSTAIRRPWARPPIQSPYWGT